MEPFFKISDKVPHASNGKCISFVGIQKVQQESTWTNGYLLSASMTSTMECSQCKVAENCLNPWTAGPTMDTFSQPGGKRGFQNFTIVNNAVNTYPLQLQEAVVSISLSFSSILSVGINIGCRRPPRLGGLVWTLRCRNPIIQSRIWLMSAWCQSTLHFITAERRHYFQHTFSHLLHIGHFPSQQNRRWSSLQFVCDVACRYYILSLLLLPGAGLACFSKLNFSFATRILICSPLPPAPGR